MYNIQCTYYSRSFLRCGCCRSLSAELNRETELIVFNKRCKKQTIKLTVLPPVAVYLAWWSNQLENDNTTGVDYRTAPNDTLRA